MDKIDCNQMTNCNIINPLEKINSKIYQVFSDIKLNQLTQVINMKKEKESFFNETINLTESAIKRVKAILNGENKPNHGLRVSVVGGGCSGMSYNLSFDDNKGEFDKIIEIEDVKIFCDLKSWLYVKGTTIDFSDDLLSGGFKINNPNAERTCGCGTSFSV